MAFKSLDREKKNSLLSPFLWSAIHPGLSLVLSLLFSKTYACHLPSFFRNICSLLFQYWLSPPFSLYLSRLYIIDGCRPFGSSESAAVFLIGRCTDSRALRNSPTHKYTHAHHVGAHFHPYVLACACMCTCPSASRGAVSIWDFTLKGCQSPHAGEVRTVPVPATDVTPRGSVKPAENYQLAFSIIEEPLEEHVLRYAICAYRANHLSRKCHVTCRKIMLHKDACQRTGL